MGIVYVVSPSQLPQSIELPYVVPNDNPYFPFEKSILNIVDLLHLGGRFIDISNIYTDSKVGLRAFGQGLSFFAFDLDQLMRVRPDFVGSFFERCNMFLIKGSTPFPIAFYDNYDNVVGAFRYMHIGEIVLSPSSADVVRERENITFPADGTYLITGGLSALEGQQNL